METGKKRNWCHKNTYSYFEERQMEREALRSKKVQKMMPPKKTTTKEIHEQQIQRRTSVYLHTSKTS